MAAEYSGARSVSVPGNKIGAGIIWGLGTFMTYRALDQMSDWTNGTIFMIAIGLQIALTLGQSPVWRGRGHIIGYACLAIDAIFNFGGVLSFVINMDQMGSIHAMASTFFEMDSEMPGPMKGVIALFIAALIAGLPEYLWKLD
jgi:hypothetical protein